MSALLRLLLLLIRKGGFLRGLSLCQLLYVFLFGQVVPAEPRERHLVDGTPAAAAAGPVFRIRVVPEGFRVVMPANNVCHRARPG